MRKGGLEGRAPKRASAPARATSGADDRAFAVADGLAERMNEVVRLVRETQDAATEKRVHRLRVCLRRCRTIARGFAAFDLEPAWRKMDKEARTLFAALGDQRDTHVLAGWVKKLSPKGDALGTIVADELRKREKEQAGAVEVALAAFDISRWAAWADSLPARAAAWKDHAAAFRNLALARLIDAHNLHKQAIRRRTPAAWHEARIGIKRFRYVIEGFFPKLDRAWGKDLKRLQDLLGETHDLDVLGELVSQPREGIDARAVAAWRPIIARERKARLDEYRRLTAGRSGVFAVWLGGFPAGAERAELGLAFLRASAASHSNDPRRVIAAEAAARCLLDGVTGQGAVIAGDPARARRVLAAASQFLAACGKRKAAAKRLAELDTPIGWTAPEIQAASLVARRANGKPLDTSRGPWRALPAELRSSGPLLAAVLGLASALRFENGASPSAIYVDEGAVRPLDIHLPDSVSCNSDDVAGRRGALEAVLARAVRILP
ncbi:CHAD domain-containing protein [bacterium]|nr:CHAD domain-containing protein [bacterium]